MVIKRSHLEEKRFSSYFYMMNLEELKKSIAENTVFTFCRSGGKGGQNVNKVNTKACGVLPVSAIRGLDEKELSEVLKKLDGKINGEKCICISVDDERSQDLNRKIALSRLESWIKSASYIKPRRRKTKPTAASKEKRLLGKKIRGMIKRNRSGGRNRDFLGE